MRLLRRGVSQKRDGFIDISLFSTIRIVNTSILKAVKYAAKKYSKGRLIDLGCGKKPYKIIFDKYVDYYVGVDLFDTSNLHYKKETEPDLWSGCTNTGLKSGQFDTLLCTQVLEHVPEPDKLIKETNRLLKNGGIAIMTIPFSWQLHAEPYDFYRFSSHGIRHLFEKNGFEILEIKAMEGAYATVQQLDILQMCNRKRDSRISRLWHKYVNGFIVIPLKSIKAMRLDKILYNDKICLNYLAVAMKK